MIRPFTFITMLLAAAAGAYLFAVKHRAQVLDDQLAAVAQQSRLDAQRIRVLQAQWALEIDPTRLNQLATQFTTLQPMKPAQLVTLASLQESLPPPGSAAPGVNPQGGVPDVVAPDGAGAPVAAVAPGLPLPPDPPPAWPPVLLAATAPAVRHVVYHSVAHSVLHVASTHFVEALAPPRPLGPTSQSLASVAPMGAQVVSVKAVSAPSGVSASGSALSMGADLAPPQPLGGTEN